MGASQDTKRRPSSSRGIGEIETLDRVLLHGFMLIFGLMKLEVLRQDNPPFGPDDLHPFIIGHVV